MNNGENFTEDHIFIELFNQLLTSWQDCHSSTDPPKFRGFYFLKTFSAYQNLFTFYEDQNVPRILSLPGGSLELLTCVCVKFVRDLSVSMQYCAS